MSHVYAPVVAGSGVIVIHRQLAQGIADYHLRPLSPRLGLFPRAAGLLAPPEAAAVTHAPPDLGPWLAHPDSQLVATFHSYALDREFRQSLGLAHRVFYGTLVRDATAAMLRRAAVVTAVSHFTASLVRREWGARARRLTVIHNGVDTTRFQPAATRTHDGVRILFAGNPLRRKGFHYLAALAASLPPGVTLHYTSGMRDHTRSARTPGLHPLPAVPHEDMPALYQAHDILLFPTLREGFGLVAAEAMACGLPVVATDCSSLPELVVDGKGGLLFAPGDMAGMREKVLRLAQDATLRAEMGAFNRERVEKDFGLERMLLAYREIFASLGA